MVILIVCGCVCVCVCMGVGVCVSVCVWLCVWNTESEREAYINGNYKCLWMLRSPCATVNGASVFIKHSNQWASLPVKKGTNDKQLPLSTVQRFSCW